MSDSKAFGAVEVIHRTPCPARVERARAVLRAAVVPVLYDIGASLVVARFAIEVIDNTDAATRPMARLKLGILKPGIPTCLPSSLTFGIDEGCHLDVGCVWRMATTAGVSEDGVFDEWALDTVKPADVRGLCLRFAASALAWQDFTPPMIEAVPAFWAQRGVWTF